MRTPNIGKVKENNRLFQLWRSQTYNSKLLYLNRWRLVFQVRTVLENPTRYHVIQKQKSQVRQYLSESFQPQTQVSTKLHPHTNTSPGWQSKIQSWQSTRLTICLFAALFTNDFKLHWYTARLICRFARTKTISVPSICLWWRSLQFHRNAPVKEDSIPRK